MNKVDPIRDMNTITRILVYTQKDNNRNFIMLMLGFYTGLRITDILSLKVKDVRNKRSIRIKEKKTGKSKEFKVNKELYRYLNEYCRGKEDYEFLIASRQGINRPITRQRANQIVKEVTGMFGLENMGCHSLRKSFGLHHYRQYKDIAILQTIFNHSVPEITLIYIGIIQEEVDETMEGLSFMQ